MPLSSGKKPGQSSKHGGQRSLSLPRDTTGYQPRVTATTSQSVVGSESTECMPRATADELQKSEVRERNKSQQKVVANEAQSSQGRYQYTSMIPSNIRSKPNLAMF